MSPKTNKINNSSYFQYYIDQDLWGFIGSQEGILDSTRIHFLDIV